MVDIGAIKWPMTICYDPWVYGPVARVIGRHQILLQPRILFSDILIHKIYFSGKTVERLIYVEIDHSKLYAHMLKYIQMF